MPGHIYIFTIAIKQEQGQIHTQTQTQTKFHQKYPDNQNYNNKLHFSFTIPNKIGNLYDLNSQKPVSEAFSIPKMELTDFTIGKHFLLDIKFYDNSQMLKYNIEVLAYADQYTKKHFSKLNLHDSILLMIKPGFIQNGKIGQIISSIQKEFQIVRFKMFLLSKQNCEEFVVTEQMQNVQNNIKNIQYLISEPSFGFQLKAMNCFLKMQKLLGNHNPTLAKKSQPNTLRAIYGQNIIKNCCHVSKNTESGNKQLSYIFSQKIKEIKPKIKNSALCLIKPHVLRQNKLGQFVTEIIKKGFYTNFIKIKQLDNIIIKKYMDLYKFLPQYAEIIDQLQSGKCCIIEISHEQNINININTNTKIVQQFKQSCGPYDPTYAKKTKPQSLRAIFGKNRALNGVHCTQLPEDAQEQLRLLFQQ